MTLQEEITRRRTFAVIAHPDAGKTTLTEKLLLFGGAIHVAGAVKSNKIKKGATSDFMEIERQRGISVATSVMGFEYQGRKINILDTPGHEDFAEDTYRTLTAVDSVIIVIDGAKGVESQTRKLMDVCRMRPPLQGSLRPAGRNREGTPHPGTSPLIPDFERRHLQGRLQHLREEPHALYERRTADGRRFDRRDQRPRLARTGRIHLRTLRQATARRHRTGRRRVRRFRPRRLPAG